MAHDTFSASNKLGAASLGALSGGNLTSTVASGSLNATVSDLGTTGKWYAELQITTFSFPDIGIADSAYGGSGAAGPTMRGWYGNGGNGICLGPGGSLGGAGANSPNTSGDYFCWAVDVPSLKVWIGRVRGGVRSWIGGGDPATGATPTFSASGGGGAFNATLTTLSGWYLYHSSAGGGQVGVLNCGDSAFAVAAPSGFTGFKTLSYTVTAGTGAYAITGIAAAFIYLHNTLVAAMGSYAITGNDAGLKTARKFAAAVGAYAITGIDAAVYAGKGMAAVAGHYTVTGIPNILVRIAADPNKFKRRLEKFVLQKLRTTPPTLED